MCRGRVGCVCVCVCACTVGSSPPGLPIRAHRSKNVSSSLERPNLEKKDMPSDGMPTCHARCLQMLREFLKVRHMHLHRKTILKWEKPESGFQTKDDYTCCMLSGCRISVAKTTSCYLLSHLGAFGLKS